MIFKSNRNFHFSREGFAHSVVRSWNCISFFVRKTISYCNFFQRNYFTISTGAVEILAVWTTHSYEIFASYSEIKIGQRATKVFGTPQFHKYRWIGPSLPHATPV